MTSIILENSINSFFGTTIQLDQRIVKTFELKVGFSYHLWRNAILQYPNIAFATQLTLKTEANYTNFINRLERKVLNRREYSEKKIDTLWDRFFIGADGELNKFGKKAINSHKIELIDFLESSLSKKYSHLSDAFGNFLNKKYRTEYKTNFIEYKSIVDEHKLNLIQNLHFTSQISDNINNQNYVIEFDNGKYKIRPFGFYSYINFENSTSLDLINTIQDNSFFGRESIEELEFLMNRDSSRELDFQYFFEKYPIFLTLLGNYSNIHSHVVLKDEYNTVKGIPDFFFEKIGSNFCDVCDLKKPNVELVKSVSKYPQFRDKVYSSLAQLSTYRNYFDERTNRDNFELRYPNLRAYKPKVVLIIGRNNYFENEIQRINLQNDLSSYVELFTYDDVLNKAKTWLRTAKSMK